MRKLFYIALTFRYFRVSVSEMTKLPSGSLVGISVAHYDYYGYGMMTDRAKRLYEEEHGPIKKQSSIFYKKVSIREIEHHPIVQAIKAGYTVIGID